MRGEEEKDLLWDLPNPGDCCRILLKVCFMRRRRVVTQHTVWQRFLKMSVSGDIFCCHNWGDATGV